MGTEEDARKLFVAGLPDTVTDEGLRALFQGTGSGIDELSLPRDRATGRPRGFAFVTLTSAADAQRAREQLDGSLLDGRSISVRPFSSDPPRGAPGGAPFGQAGGFERRPPRDDSNRTLYVGNLPYDIEDADLRSLFSQMGAKDLDRIHLPIDHATGRKRGFAFVSFINEDAAKAALEVLGNLTVRGRPCTVHIAHPRGERPPPRQDRGFGGPGPRASSPPPGIGRGPSGFGGGGFGGGPGGSSGRTSSRRANDDFERDRGGKGMGARKKLQAERQRGGGNARRYLEEDWDDDE